MSETTDSNTVTDDTALRRQLVFFQQQCAAADAELETLRAEVKNRDRDWILAIGHALGLDNNYQVPIAPEVEPFKKLFAEIRGRASARQDPCSHCEYITSVMVGDTQGESVHCRHCGRKLNASASTQLSPDAEPTMGSQFPDDYEPEPPGNA